jgi:hypothetical protein
MMSTTRSMSDSSHVCSNIWRLSSRGRSCYDQKFFTHELLCAFVLVVNALRRASHFVAMTFPRSDVESCI